MSRLAQLIGAVETSRSKIREHLNNGLGQNIRERTNAGYSIGDGGVRVGHRVEGDDAVEHVADRRLDRPNSLQMVHSRASRVPTAMLDTPAVIDRTLEDAAAQYSSRDRAAASSFDRTATAGDPSAELTDAGQRVIIAVLGDDKRHAATDQQAVSVFAATDSDDTQTRGCRDQSRDFFADRSQLDVIDVVHPLAVVNPSTHETSPSVGADESQSRHASNPTVGGGADTPAPEYPSPAAAAPGSAEAATPGASALAEGSRS